MGFLLPALTIRAKMGLGIQVSYRVEPGGGRVKPGHELDG